MCPMAHGLEINSQGVINEKWSPKLLFFPETSLFTCVATISLFCSDLLREKEGMGKIAEIHE